MNRFNADEILLEIKQAYRDLLIVDHKPSVDDLDRRYGMMRQMLGDLAKIKEIIGDE